MFVEHKHGFQTLQRGRTLKGKKCAENRSVLFDFGTKTASYEKQRDRCLKKSSSDTTT